MLLIEYRICMPLSVEEYERGQLYMIAKHCHEQSEAGEGVEVVVNESCDDPKHGKGQVTEKRIYLSSRLPGWIQAIIPNIFYIREQASNFYPFTITEYTCSFVPRFSIYIETCYENNSGSTENALGLEGEELAQREVDVIDIAYDDVPEHQYKEEEDLKTFHSETTDRGPLEDGWKDSVKPIMCCYKVVRVKFEVWGLQTRVEAYTHRAVRDILLLGHRQAVAWMDEWFGWSKAEIRDYEKTMQEKTNLKVNINAEEESPLASGDVTTATSVTSGDATTMAGVTVGDATTTAAVTGGDATTTAAVTGGDASSDATTTSTVTSDNAKLTSQLDDGLVIADS